jgi:hypothetical protein
LIACSIDGKISVAVQQRREAIAGKDDGTQHHPHRALELRVMDLVTMLELFLDPLFACHQVLREKDDQQRREHADQHGPNDGSFLAGRSCQMHRRGLPTSAAIIAESRRSPNSFARPASDSSSTIGRGSPSASCVR